MTKEKKSQAEIQKMSEERKGFTLRNSIRFAATNGAPLSALRREASRLFVTSKGRYTVNPTGAYPVVAQSRADYAKI